jgi:branched-chain amino acid transport system permease protein
VRTKTVTTYLSKAYRRFALHILDIPSRLLALLLIVLFLTIPGILPSSKIMSYLLSVLITASVMAIFASSWDLLVGRCGQISLGHAIFYGLGAYTTALLFKHYGLPPWVGIPISVLIAAAISLPIGFPALRVKGPYLALVSLAFPLIATSIVFATKGITGGENGLPISVAGRFFQLTNIHNLRIAEYYLTFFLLLVSAIIIHKIANSDTGVVFVSILDDEMASKACGINVTRYKLMAFAISAVFASLAGGVNVHLLLSASHSDFSLTLSFFAVIMTVLGGMGTIYGAIVGAYIIYFLDMYFLRMVVEIPDVWHILIFIVPVIILVIKLPRGVARFVTDKLEDLSEERPLEERGKWIWKKYRRKKKSANED